MKYAPASHLVFELVPEHFHLEMDRLYQALGAPKVTMGNFWTIYQELLEGCVQSAMLSLPLLSARAEEELQMLNKYMDLCPHEVDDETDEDDGACVLGGGYYDALQGIEEPGNTVMWDLEDLLHVRVHPVLVQI
ncbi:hypothetical protein DACRYDRAFT_105832 [Dacryopinax primogenitus]|uniref:Uncharacterized protein n=1 Tax=Dacryopinax primogenitus (strain DJM 731) TaxID=1858805 RepID=M5G093_DACPD|nr:uncharacterized protein DACRYDRAFT_105832 [Dacryopinax primogenitus]EJU03671.1 hypothetical protein DACRYDRAFT_105832 [Dacryopinax primogenitus]